MINSLNQVKYQNNQLLTFAVFAYNQAEFIREAIESAFSQKYEPLEIILSDDCSTDDTFKIIKEMADLYTGPHKIYIRKNTNNLGLCHHFNKVAEISNGALIVVAAGDDVSLPNRVDAIHEQWLLDGQPLLACYTSLMINHKTLDEYKVRLSKPTINEYLSCNMQIPIIAGATAAYTKDLILLRPLLWGMIEDVTLSWRCMVNNGEIKKINKVLVRYRVGDSLSHGYNVDNPLKLKSRILWDLCAKNNMLIEYIIACDNNPRENVLDAFGSILTSATKALAFDSKNPLKRFRAHLNVPFLSASGAIGFWLQYYKLNRIAKFLRIIYHKLK